MTFGGWATFILSACSFTALFAWCLYNVLSKPSNGGEPPGGSVRGGGKSDAPQGARRKRRRL